MASKTEHRHDAAVDIEINEAGLVNLAHIFHQKGSLAS